MDDLKKKLEQKRKELRLLTLEVIEIEKKAIEEEWKDKPACYWSFKAVSEGMCPHGNTYRSMVYCKNPNCHK